MPYFGLTPLLASIASLVVTWIVSAIVLWISAKVLDSKEGLGTALIAALIGALIFGFFSYLGGRLLFTLLAFFLWLYALKSLFMVGWGRAFLIALIAWILGAVVWVVLGVPMTF